MEELVKGTRNIYAHGSKKYTSVDSGSSKKENRLIIFVTTNSPCQKFHNFIWTGITSTFHAEDDIFFLVNK